jgi:hypothetical protein
MGEKKKRKYVKPEVTKIHLDAECAVLGACKTSGQAGPGGSGCLSLSFPCSSHGS